MAKKENDIGQKRAFIRENALVLYFDKAETPFVARYDLDTLVQANFEVSDKKDGLFTLGLRDYSGRAQDVGQFSNKADAHQALYTILQALLEHKGNHTACARGPFGLCRIGCAFLTLLKWILLTIGVLAVLYIVLGMIPAPNHMLSEKARIVTELSGQQSSGESLSGGISNATIVDLSALPEGDVVDADALFLQHDPLAVDADADADDNEADQDKNQ